MNIKLQTEQNLEFLSLKGGCTGSSESTHVKIPHSYLSRMRESFVQNAHGDLSSRVHRLQYLFASWGCNAFGVVYKVFVSKITFKQYLSGTLS